jgi:hypothetical protein
LWRYVSGDETTRLYEAVCAHVRSSGQPASFPFRCDAPLSKRFMQMTISPGPDGSLSFASRQLREEVSSRGIAYICRPRVTPSLILRCSICNRLRVGGRWCDPTEAIAEGGLFVNTAPLQIAYSICGECSQHIESMLFTR